MNPIATFYMNVGLISLIMYNLCLREFNLCRNCGTIWDQRNADRHDNHGWARHPSWRGYRFQHTMLIIVNGAWFYTCQSLWQELTINELRLIKAVMNQANLHAMFCNSFKSGWFCTSMQFNFWYEGLHYLELRGYKSLSYLSFLTNPSPQGYYGIGENMYINNKCLKRNKPFIRV